MQGYKSVIIFQVVLLAIQGAAYLLIQHSKHPVHDMVRPIDHKIPLVPQFIFVYVTWYPLIGVFPLILYGYDPAVYQAYIVSIIVDIIISLTVYWFYPTSFVRPKPPKDSLSGRALGIMYIVDYKGRNCMPSMHCSMCYIILYYTFVCTAMPDGLAAGLIALCTFIVLGTVFTKQHVLVDVITALPVSIVCIIAASLI